MPLSPEVWGRIKEGEGISGGEGEGGEEKRKRAGKIERKNTFIFFAQF